VLPFPLDLLRYLNMAIQGLGVKRRRVFGVATLGSQISFVSLRGEVDP
jgi:hypothetical protein